MNRLTISLLLLLFACEPRRQQTPASVSPQPAGMRLAQMSRDSLYDKILGMLAGAAIGDAMGAPTEMWSRDMIQAEYGHVEGLDDMVREPSPEGIWDYNLPAGSTTDDTRWKGLMLDFLAGSSEAPRRRPAAPNPEELARFIMSRYEAGLSEVRERSDFYAEPYEAGMRKALWLSEWATVAKPYVEKNLDAYSRAQNRFYGGEMVCGGMLFAPVIGAAYPGDPAWAYQQTLRLNIWDIGYGRDIAALTAGMTAAAMAPGATPDSVYAVMRDVDPEGYFRSRLVGRMAYYLYRDACYIKLEADKAALHPRIGPNDMRLALPLRTREDSVRYVRLMTAYSILDTKLQRMPFHPGEIHLICLTAMKVCDFDFRTSLQFIINYGRDNDTSGAVAGGILGAYYGAKGLPADLLEPVLRRNPALGFDLEEMARRLTDSVYEGN